MIIRFLVGGLPGIALLKCAEKVVPAPRVPCARSRMIPLSPHAGTRENKTRLVQLFIRSAEVAGGVQPEPVPAPGDPSGGLEGVPLGDAAPLPALLRSAAPLRWMLLRRDSGVCALAHLHAHHGGMDACKADADMDTRVHRCTSMCTSVVAPESTKGGELRLIFQHILAPKGGSQFAESQYPSFLYALVTAVRLIALDM